MEDDKRDLAPHETANPIMAARAGRAMQELDRVAPRSTKWADTSTNSVTDLKYSMDGYLKENLNEVPKFLKKAWDCVIIVSGNGKVRIGKSTLAMQVAYYIAWLLNEQKIKNKEVPVGTPVPFDNSNVVFDPDTLMKTAEHKPRNSVLVYDEGRAGLDSARAMENINKATQDFFQECGQYGHVMIIVLPDFFKLNETIAIPRSLFLLNCYTDKNYNRGYFSFYSEQRKELLYIIGKKKWGSTSKYMSVDDNFHGRFFDYFPINKESYDKSKKEALRKRRKTHLEVRWHIERDFFMWILNKKVGWDDKTIAKELNRYPDMKISENTVQNSILKIRKILEREHYEDLEQETAY